MPLSHDMSDGARYTLAALTGIVMPSAVPPNLRTLADLYETVGKRVTEELMELLEMVRRRVRADFSGRAADYFDRSVAQFTTGENDYVGKVGAISSQMAQELRKAAANAEYMAMMIIGQLIQLIVEIAWAIASAYWTFGASLKWIPIFKAIRSLAMRRILAWFLLTVPSHLIISQIFASMDSIIQRIQLNNGSRDAWDHDLTKGAHLGAVFEGLISAALSGGVDILLDGQITKVINKNLLDLDDLPDPPPITNPKPDPVPDPVADPPPVAKPRPEPVPEEAPPIANPKPDPDPDDLPPATGPRPEPERDTLPPPGRGLNHDLADVFTRNNDELGVPFTQGDAPGVGSWANDVSAANLRRDFADLFERHFGDDLGSAAARRLGEDYADAFARNWPGPDLSAHLRQALGDSLPPPVRDHLADTVPNTLVKGLADLRTGKGAYAQNLGLGASTGALEGYLGEGVANAALEGEWKASGFSASAGATNATAQTVVTDASVTGIDALRGGPDLPPPLTAPPTASTGNPSDGTSEDTPTDTGATGGRDGSNRDSDDGGGPDGRGSHDGSRDEGRGDDGGSDGPGRGSGRGSEADGGTETPVGDGTDDTDPVGDRGGGRGDGNGTAGRGDASGAPGSGSDPATAQRDVPPSPDAPANDNPYVTPFASELTDEPPSASEPGASERPGATEPTAQTRESGQDDQARTPGGETAPAASEAPVRSDGDQNTTDSDPDVDWPLGDLYDSTGAENPGDGPGTSPPFPSSPLDLSGLFDPKESLLTPDLSFLDPKAGLGLPQSPLPWLTEDLRIFAVPEITPDPSAGTTTDGDAPPVAQTAPGTTPLSGQGDTNQRSTTQQANPGTQPAARTAPPAPRGHQTDQQPPAAVPTTSRDADGHGPTDTAPPPPEQVSTSSEASDNAQPPEGASTATNDRQAPPPGETAQNSGDGRTAAPNPADGAPPPPRRTGYEGSLTPDRSGRTYHLGYLTASTLVGPHMAAAENVDTFVENTLDDVGGLDDPARERIMEAFAEVFRDHGPRPFLAPGGHTVRVQGPDGTWTATLDLSTPDDDFRHVPTRPADDAAQTAVLRTQTAGIGVNDHDSGSRAGSKSVGAKFTASPVYVADIGVARAGPLVSLGGRFGTRVRGTEVGASASANSDTEIWQLAPPELYAADLDMDLTVTPPAAPPTGGTESGGSAPVPAPGPHTARGRSTNSLVLNLPGEVVAHPDLPPRIALHSGPTPAPGQPPRTAVHHPAVGHPLSVGAITPVPGGTGGDDRPGHTGLGPWIADHMLTDPETSIAQWVSEHLPGGSDRRRRRLDEFRQSVERAFHPDQLQNLLPQITNTPANIRVTAPDGSERIMRLWSVPSSYTRKDHAPALVDLLHNNTATKGTSSSVKHSKGITGTFGGGFGLHIDLPGGRSIRLDAPFVEYAYTFGSNTGTTRGQTATSSTFTHGTPRFGAYDVERDFYVQFEGESDVHRFRGSSVDLLNAEDARTLRDQVDAGDDSGTPATVAPDARAKVPPFPNLRGDRVTDLSGAHIRGFDRTPDSATPGTGADTGATAADGDSATTASDTGTDASADDGHRSVPEELGHRILTGIARQRPGLVIPDLARGRGDYARRPGKADAPYLDRSPREHTGLRRDQDVARENTMRILDAVSESNLKSSRGDLVGDGIVVHLTEPALVDLPSTARGRELARPDTVAVRITADLGPLRHTTESEISSGARVNGATGITGTSGRGHTHSVTGSVGMNLREDDGADARGVPAKFGTPSVSLTLSSGRSRGVGQGITHSTEDRVMFSGGNDVWTADIRFDARLHEHDDLGQVRGGRPIRERGIPLIGGGLNARTTLTTPKVRSAPDRAPEPARTADPAPLSADQARGVIRRGFVPTGPVPAPPAASSGSNGRVGPMTLSEYRAKEIIGHGGTVEQVNTDLGSGPNRPGLVQQTYDTFGTARDGLHHGYSRKLEHLLTDTPAARRTFENRLSGQTLATDPSAGSSSGARTRQEMSGGLFSPHDIRTTIATRVELESITDFFPVDAQIWWNSGTEISLATDDGTSLAWSGRVGFSGTDNPNPAGSDGSTPSEAIRPIPVGGPSFGFTPYSTHRSASHGNQFSSSVLFIPQVAWSYAFRGSGHITQAMEFLKNWSIGPTIPWNIRYRGWRVPVQNLFAGYVHAHDAHASHLVQDAVTDTGSGPVPGVQPNPKRPDDLVVRPGFENTGRQMRPADPNASLQNLVDDLARDGLELTGNSREQLLHGLTTQLGNKPAASVPVPVKVRPIGQTAHRSSDAKVYVNQRATRTDIRFVGFAADYIESRSWRDTRGHGESRGTSATLGVDGTALQPTGYDGDESGPEEQPGSRPLFVAPSAGLSTGTGRTSGTGSSDSATRTVELQMHVPYAKITQDTDLTLTLELGVPDTDAGAGTPDGDGPTGGERRTTFTGRGPGGEIETLFPFAYLAPAPSPTTGTSASGADDTTAQAGPSGTGTDRGTRNDRNQDGRDQGDGARDGRDQDGRVRDEQNQDGGDGAAPDHPRSTPFASLDDMMRTWTTDTRGAAPDDIAPSHDTVILPVAVQDHGQAVRDTAMIVIARSLGWTPPADAVRDGAYTPGAVDDARSHIAAELKLDTRHNAIDHSLDDDALQALYPSASRADGGVRLLTIGRTEWAVKALPDMSAPKILDVVPGTRISDNLTHGGGENRSREETSTTGGNADALRAMGLSTQAAHDYDGHEGIYPGGAGHSSSRTEGAGRGVDKPVKRYPQSDRLRQGPAYLVEFDTRWAIGAASKLPRLTSWMKSVTGSGPETGPSPSHGKPARWQLGDTSTRLTGWVSEDDAVGMGILTRAQADQLRPTFNELHAALQAFADAEKSYADARGPLEDLADDVVNGGDGAARQRYDAQKARYDQALADFNRSIDRWTATLDATRNIVEDPRDMTLPRGKGKASEGPLPTITESTEPPGPSVPDEARRLRDLAADLTAEARDLRSGLQGALDREARAGDDVERLEQDVQRLAERDIPQADRDREAAERTRSGLKPQVASAREAAENAQTQARDADDAVTDLTARHTEQRSQADDARGKADQARDEARNATAARDTAEQELDTRTRETADLAQRVRDLGARVRSLETADREARNGHALALDAARAERDRHGSHREQGPRDTADPDSVRAWEREADRLDGSARSLEEAADQALAAAEEAARNLTDTRAEHDRLATGLDARRDGDARVEERVRELRDRADGLRTAATRAERTADTARSRADELLGQRDTAREKAVSAAARATELRNRADDLDTRFAEAESALTDHRRTLDSLIRELGTAENDLDARRRDLADARDEATEIRVTARDLEQRAGRALRDADRIEARAQRPPGLPSERAADEDAAGTSDPDAISPLPRTGPPVADLSHLTDATVMAVRTPPAQGWPAPPAWGQGLSPEGMTHARTFDTDEDSAAYLTRNMPPPPMNTTENAYVRYYTAEGSYVINNELRSGVTPERATPSMRNAVRDLDAVLDRARAPEPILLYRSIDLLPDQLDASPNFPDHMAALVGRTFTDPGYGSAAMSHQPLHPDRRIQFSIRVPRGYPVLNAMDVPGVTNRDEHEVMIRRGSTYLVHSVTRLPDDQYGLKRWSVEVEIVPDGWTPPTRSSTGSDDTSTGGRDGGHGDGTGSGRGAGGGAGAGRGRGQGAPPPPATHDDDGADWPLGDTDGTQDDTTPADPAAGPPGDPRDLFGLAAPPPWLPGLDPKEPTQPFTNGKAPFDPNGLLHLPFPDTAPAPTTDQRPEQTPDTTPWPAPPAWGQGVHPQGMREGHTPGTTADLPRVLSPTALTDEQASVVDAFTAPGGATALNDALREGTGTQDQHNTVDTLDALTESSTTPDALILHHHTDTTFADRLGIPLTDPNARENLVGRTYTEPGYIGTTTTAPQLDHRTPVHIILKVPQGYPALTTARASGPLPGSGPDVLLRRGTTLLIHDVRHVRDELYDNDHWTVEAEVVPDDWTPTPDWRSDPRHGQGGLPPASTAPATRTDDTDETPPGPRPHPGLTDGITVMTARTPDPAQPGTSGDGTTAPVSRPRPPEGARSRPNPAEGTTPPAPVRTEYPGSLRPDRSGPTRQLNYLTASALVGPHMAGTENVDTFVDDTLSGIGSLGADDRQRFMDAFAEVFRVHGPDPFLVPGGHTVQVQGPEGTWSATLSLTPSDDGFRHVPTRPAGDSAPTKFLRTQAAGIGVNAHDSGSRGGNKSTGFKFTVSPAYVTDWGVARWGPLFSFGARYGSGVRGTGVGASRSANSDTEIWQLDAPELYVTDVDMDLTVRPPAAPPTTAAPADGTDIALVPRPRTSRGRSTNGFFLNLPGEVVAHPDMPRSIRLHTGPTPAPGQPPRTVVNHAGVGHPVSVGDITPVTDGSDGGTGSTRTGLGRWIADHLLVNPPTRVSQWVSEHLPGGRARQRRRLDEFRGEIERGFHPDQIQNHLPQITSTPSTLTVTGPDGTRKMMTMWSVPTSYSRKDDSPRLIELLHNSTSAKGTVSSVNRSKGVSGTGGFGFGFHIDLPGGRSVRFDAPFFEYTFTHGSNTANTRTQNATASRFAHGEPQYAAYDVERDFYVRFEGESDVHRFRGSSVDLLTLEDARALSDLADPPGSRPTATGDRTATPGQSSVPRRVPPFPNLRGERLTDLSGANIRQFTWPAHTAGPAHGNAANSDGRTVHQELGHRILTSIAERHPGMVIPELARTSGNYARRPGNENADYFERSFREHWGLRRDYEVARENTMRVLDAVSESNLKSNRDDLTADGIAVPLVETAFVDPPSTVRGEEIVRPDFVTVRVFADFGPLRHTAESDASSGTRVAGAAGTSTEANRSNTHSYTLSLGANLRQDDGADARGVPATMFTPSASGTYAHGSGRGVGQSLTHSAEDRVMFSGGNDVWTSQTRFDARLYEHDDLGQVPDDPPLRRRGVPVLGDGGVSTLTTVTTPKVSAPPRVPPAPAPVTTAAPANTSAPAPGSTSAPGRNAAPAVTLLGADEASAVIRRGFVPDHPVTLLPNPAEGTHGPRRDMAGHRADMLLKHGATIEFVNTDLGNGRARMGLVARTYGAFGPGPDGTPPDFTRKIQNFLAHKPASRFLFENRLSGQTLATDHSATSPSGARTRQEMSGGFLSPHDIRATVATLVNFTSVTVFFPVDAQIWWNSGAQVSLSTNDFRSTTWSGRLGAGGTDNPNRAGTDDSLPSEAVRPIPIGGPAFGFTPRSVTDSTTRSHGFSSSVLFIPQVAWSYAFRGSGDITQALEFLKNWSIGPTLPWNIRYRGWRVPVDDLLSGYVHAHDAHASHLVQDAVDDAGGGPALGFQPNPKAPNDLVVRPGFENTGRQMRPADPNTAIQRLVDDLGSEGLELTGDSREHLLHTLTTQLGNNPAKAVPVPVRVRPAEGTLKTATDAKVYVDLRATTTRTRFVSFAGDYIESRTWTDTSGRGESRGTSIGAGADVTLLQPTGYDGDESGPEGQPGSRPLFVAPNTGVNTSSGENTSRNSSDSPTRTVEIQMQVPYAKIIQDAHLGLTLELSEPVSGTSGDRTGDSRSGGAPRTAFTGSGDGGEIETLYLFSYLAFAQPPATSTSTDGTDTRGTRPRARDGRSQNGRNHGGRNRDGLGSPAPEHPVNTGFASLYDMMTTWATNTRGAAAPGSVPSPEVMNDIVFLPVAVQDHGQAIRDTAAVVLAKSLEWTPPADAVRDGAYTPEAISDARSHIAAELKLDTRSNAIDRTLDDLALQGLYPSASRNDDGVPLLTLGRTDWGVKALPDVSDPRILDASPGTKLTDNLTTGGADSRNRGASSTTGGSADPFRPMGLSTEPLHDYDKHEGIYTGNAPGYGSSRTEGSGGGSDQPVKRYPEADRLRLGTAYLVEFDTTWAIGAASKPPRWAALTGGTDDRGPEGNSPRRWQLGDTTVRLSGWVSEADAIRMGVLTRTQADRLRPALNTLYEARLAFAEAEAAYADARRPLEQLADDVVNGPDRGAARERYDTQKAAYDQALADLDDAVDRWTAILRNTRNIIENPRDMRIPDPKGKGKAPVRDRDGEGAASRSAETGSDAPTVTPDTTAGDGTGLLGALRSTLNVEPTPPGGGTPPTDDATRRRLAEAERVSEQALGLRDRAEERGGQARDLRRGIPELLRDARGADANVTRLERVVRRLDERDVPAARQDRDTAVEARKQLRDQLALAREAADEAETTAGTAAERAGERAGRHRELEASAAEARTEARSARREADDAVTRHTGAQRELGARLRETTQLTRRTTALRQRIQAMEDTARSTGGEAGPSAPGASDRTDQDLAHLRTVLSRSEAELRDRQVQDTDARERVQELGQDARGLGDAADQAERERDTAQQRADAMGEEAEQARHAAQEAADAAESARRQVHDLDTGLEEAEAEASRTQKQLDTLNRQLQDARNSVSAHRSTARDARARADDLRRRADRLDRQAEDARGEAERLERHVLRLLAPSTGRDDHGPTVMTVLVDPSAHPAGATPSEGAPGSGADRGGTGQGTPPPPATHDDDGTDWPLGDTDGTQDGPRDVFGLAAPPPWLPGLDPKEPTGPLTNGKPLFDPNGLLHLPFPDTTAPTTRDTPQQTTDQGPEQTPDTTPWPAPHAWGQGAPPQGMREGQSFEYPGQGAMYLSLAMSPPSMSDEQASVVDAFTAPGGATALNDALREGTGTQDQHNTVDTLDALTESSTTPDALILHHHTDTTFADRLGIPLTDPNARENLVGRTYTEPGYIGTTTTAPQLDHRTPVHIILKVPQGYPALTTAGPRPDNGPDVLLRRGTTLLIHDVRHVRDELYDNDHWTVEAEVVPDDWTPTPDWRSDPRHGQGGLPPATETRGEGEAPSTPRPRPGLTDDLTVMSAFTPQPPGAGQHGGDEGSDQSSDMSEDSDESSDDGDGEVLTGDRDVRNELDPAPRWHGGPREPGGVGMGPVLRFMDDAEAARWANEHLPAVTDPARAHSVSEYTGADYTLAHEGLRHGNVGEYRRDDFVSLVHNVDAAIAASPLPAAVIVHKGVDSGFTDNLGIDPHDPATITGLVGTVHTEPSFVSTSLGSRTPYDRPVYVMFRVPEGFPALNAAPLSHAPREREILIPRGSSFVIHAAYQRLGQRAEGGPVGPVWFVEAEFVPDGWTPPAGWMPRPFMNADAGYRPGTLGPDGVRRFGSNAEGEAYGEGFLAHPGQGPGAFPNLPPEHRDAIVAYTNFSRPYNELLRAPESDRGRILRSWFEGGGDAWGLYELAGGRPPTVADIRNAAARMDELAPDVREAVREIVNASDPEWELRTWRSWAGQAGRLVDLFGHIPDLDDLTRQIGVLDRAIDASRLPEATVTHRGLTHAAFLDGFSADDPQSLVGTVQHEPAFMSTSVGAGVHVYLGGFIEPVRIHFRLPAGTRAMWVGRSSTYPDQRELIIARGTSYLITAVLEQGDGTLDIFADVLAPPPTAGTGTGTGTGTQPTDDEEGTRTHG